ncbi:MAG: putative DNA binding domain-containing protein [Deltaproteobacteria bacterium]|jgi:ATP-dependent DNA helicase RecG|nr:putative DNA binding domain-containing protein [Deltaproteobacteria bacterium]
MDDKELLKLLKAHEWNNVEFKQARQAIPKSAYESVSAFANTEGGHLVFGVKKDGSNFDVVGVLDVDKMQNEFLSALRQKDKINQTINVKEHLHSIDEKDLLVFYVPEASRTAKPLFLNGDIRRSFLRKGACDVRCTPEELQRLMSDASANRYDGHILDYDINKCYNKKDIAWYRRQYEGKADNRSYTDLDDLEFLFQIGLIKETNKGRKPTIASVLLLGQDGYLRGLLPRPVIDCQRYLFNYNDYSTEERWHDRTVCDYNLVQSWLAVVEWYYKFAEIPFEVDPKTLQRKDTPPDYIAFREAIINMLIHQDYADHSRKPAITHFNDLTRFWNPGDAFAQVKDLLEPGEKETRNPLLVTAFRRIGFSENAGWGLRDVFKNWRGLGKVPPEIFNDKAKKTFELVLRKEILLSEKQIKFQKNLKINLSEDEAVIFAYACKHKSISLYDIRDILGKSLQVCESIADHLVAQDLFIQIDKEFYELSPEILEQFKQIVIEAYDEVHDEVHDNLTKTEFQILNHCEYSHSTPELLKLLGYKSITGNYRTALSNLLSKGYLERTIPERPRSKNQKYKTTQKGMTLVQSYEVKK